VYNFSVQRLQLVDTGMWSLLYQLSCISLSFVALFVRNYDLSMAMLIGGVCASRTGLWVFDITVTQLMQEFVPEGVRGVVGGTQHSLNAFFQLLSFALGLVFPDPKDFPIYASAGYAAVVVAAISFVVVVLYRRAEFTTLIERSRHEY
jgi:solute carrier family 40 (iron-regulated transporter), member 1